MWRSRLAWFYLAVVALAWALGEWGAEASVPTLLLAYLPPVVWLLPAPLVLCWTLIRRDGRRRGWATAVLASALAAWGAGLLHSAFAPAPATSAAALRVVTFNTARGTRIAPDKMAANLRAMNADVLMLQETRFMDSDYRAALVAGLPDYALHSAGEVMTLISLKQSRLPVLKTQVFAAPGSNRQYLQTTLGWRGQRLRVVNVHLNTVLLSRALAGDWDSVGRTRDVRNQQVGLLEQIAAAESGPLLLAGDLNTPPRGRLYRRLIRAYGPDAHDQAGRGPGWTFPSLYLRIDHALARGLQPVRVQVLPDAGSDHLPLLVEYALTQTGE
ncbi:endonuclease/exonuclease/phosphatase family protein [Deinococcus sp. QL22]|uniref:endonuclease/exonuclease/phosphatase family protein n=1 Tax=Deinococcus sp. QL22 TaxID=2939437 RepID=UPI0020179EA2|nr:endonuclease/exonuclease/phosphatase family protein [Deinococcus sp. QL22]UQN05052.1 endonuclease/exonuclease/phosphatase family protein [Deinococcus sp. QL22]